MHHLYKLVVVSITAHDIISPSTNTCRTQHGLFLTMLDRFWRGRSITSLLHQNVGADRPDSGTPPIRGYQPSTAVPSVLSRLILVEWS